MNWLGTILDRTNSSNIMVRGGLREIDKWRPALTEEQWKQAKFMAVDETVDDRLMCSLTLAGKFSVPQYINKYRPSRGKEWTDKVWNKVLRVE